MGIRFPYGTLIVNITACVIIGFSMTLTGSSISTMGLRLAGSVSVHIGIRKLAAVYVNAGDGPVG